MQKKTLVDTPLRSIQLEESGKRFNRDWIFRNISYAFQPGKAYAITGPNGSGKSTLLQAIAGSLYLSKGKIIYQAGSSATGLEPEYFFKYLSIAAPYLELIEEMTAREILSFHNRFKPLIRNLSIEEMLTLIGLEKSMDKQIRFFSSGMKQRLKLAQAIFTDAPVLLLDEPCTNLDKPGYALYHTLIQDYCMHKLIIVSSNDAHEMDFCQEKLDILDYKSSS
ncbi:MAG: ATP-binding cassette domain-containing protein [Bacteroidota bacterium]|nr:ATP-binding cassette domain-containing protein [Bacteroidota bacterium]